MMDVHELLRTHEAQKQARAEQLPTEQDCFRVLNQAFLRLSELGWRDAIYCPKNGDTFLAVEGNHSKPFRCMYMGEWPEGGWWELESGELYPARPTLFKPLPEVAISKSASDGGIMSKSVWSLIAGEQKEIPPIDIAPDAAADIAKAVGEFVDQRESYKPPRNDIDMSARYD